MFFSEKVSVSDSTFPAKSEIGIHLFQSRLVFSTHITPIFDTNYCFSIGQNFLSTIQYRFMPIRTSKICVLSFFLIFWWSNGLDVSVLIESYSGDTFPIYVMKCCFLLINFLLIALFSVTVQALNAIDLCLHRK